METIVVLGSGGQLGQELYYSGLFASHDVYFLGKQELDITDRKMVKSVFSKLQPDWIINCAAYTQVDAAEDNEKAAFEVNADAVKVIAEQSTILGAKLIHLSTDYVYDNDLRRPLKETDSCDPKGVYARSKHLGEQYICSITKQYYILRTSWVYGQYGDNFVKTMLRLGAKLDEIRIVQDQIGAPTWTRDIAYVVSRIIHEQPDYGVYNYSGDGQCSWYEFAYAIFQHKGCDIVAHPISTVDYGAKAPRPHYSVLDCSKIESALRISRIHWKQTLHGFLSLI